MKNGKKQSRSGLSVENVTIKSNKDEVIKATNEAIERALINVGMEWQNAASLLPPVVTGRLRASITFATKNFHSEPDTSLLKKKGVLKRDDYKPQATPLERHVVIGTNVEYAQKIEEGGAKEERHSHFLRNSLNNNRERFKEIIEEELSGI